MQHFGVKPSAGTNSTFRGFSTAQRTLMSAVRVSGLNHEAFDDAMEQQRVVKVFFYQSQEVVAMAWGVVVECQQDIPFCGL